ncbi:hypothetical protein C8J57DRAFT_1327267 [Mycena rebaudengoi]|nr:hypothetical protein C8J57DRAFT_1327267 [Mycena rebaudengoi]
MSLSLFPEELLEHILLPCVLSPAYAHPRTPWHRAALSSNNNNTTVIGRTAPLLVCRAFHRIARPLFYNTVVLHSAAQAQAFSLADNETLAHVRHLVLLAPPPPALLHRLFAHAPLRSLDINLPAAPHITPDLDAMVRVLAGGCACESDSDCDCEDLRITHLTLRKPPSAYLSTPAARAVLAAVAQMLRRCVELHTVTTTFPLPASPASPGGTTASYTPPAHPTRRHTVGSASYTAQTPQPPLSPQGDGQPDADLDLPTALAHLPPLRTLRTPLPAVWAPALLRAAQNAGLERIVLDAGERQRSATMPVGVYAAPSPMQDACGAKPPLDPTASAKLRPFDQLPPHTPRPTSLFLAAARAHPRLAALLRAGMGDGVFGAGVRGRAWTLPGAGRV